MTVMAPAALTREQTVGLAESFAGIAEAPPNSNRVMFSEWYGLIGPWCAMFVSYVLYYAHHSDPPPLTTAKGFSYCPALLDWATRRGRWRTDLNGILPGDLPLYSFGHHRPDHVEIARSAGLNRYGQIETIGGNTSGGNPRDGGSVQLRNRKTDILGYVRLDYPTKSVVTDTPHWTPLTRTLVPGVTGDDVLRWKFCMVVLGLGSRFAGMNDRQWHSFGETTSVEVAKEFKRRWNSTFITRGAKDPMYLGTGGDVGGKSWKAVHTCMEIKGHHYV